MSVMASQITNVLTVCSTVCSGADQRKLQNSASLAFARGILLWLVASPHKGQVTRKVFPFDDAIMLLLNKTTNHSPTIRNWKMGILMMVCGSINSVRLNCSIVVGEPTSILQMSLLTFKERPIVWWLNEEIVPHPSPRHIVFLFYLACYIASKGACV